ncbi:MAG: FAD/FMN-containing dehydrogenase [Paracoccaceae bacterium]|jgi:FAD/FMN-containing dehydrogenase
MELNAADPSFLNRLEAALPKGRLRDPLEHELDEPRGRGQAIAAAIACPKSVDEVSIILKTCNSEKVGLVPLGGGTGLVMGQGMQTGPMPLMLSVEHMRALRAAYPQENLLVVEAGMVLADVQKSAHDLDRQFPLSLASQGSCQIGGNLAANAGGTGVLRYGNARDLCLGIEAVLADGKIYNGLKRLRKDNSGYDVKNLLIGSEGSLGIITAATLRLYPAHGRLGAAMFAVPSIDAALELYGLAQARLGGMISAFEIISEMSFTFLSETMPDVRVPFAKASAWTVFIDVDLPNEIEPNLALTSLYSAAEDNMLVLDGVIASSLAQRSDFWRLRENIPVANRKVGPVSSHDLSLPLGEIASFIAKAGPALASLGDMRINCFGHLGDGNLHYNLFPALGRTRADYENLRPTIKGLVHGLVASLGGSVSAEHGIGRLKVEDLLRYGDPTKLAMMRAVKTALDPNGILNPGVILPS